MSRKTWQETRRGSGSSGEHPHSASHQPGLILYGVITNVAAFGAFDDIGVHPDGLVHISALAEKYVKNPHDVVKAGDVVKVKVMEVDEKRKRIALTMRLNDTAVPREKNANSSAGAPYWPK